MKLLPYLVPVFLVLSLPALAQHNQHRGRRRICPSPWSARDSTVPHALRNPAITTKKDTPKPRTFIAMDSGSATTTVAKKSAFTLTIHGSMATSPALSAADTNGDWWEAAQTVSGSAASISASLRLTWATAATGSGTGQHRPLRRSRS